MCIRCRRPLLRASITVGTAAGPRMFGPKCAQLAGLAPKPQKRKQKPVRRREDPQQLDWVAEVVQ